MTDWESIKTEYITTDISYRNLAEKHGVGLSTLCKRAGKEHWHQGRIKHNNKIVTKAADKIANRKINKLANLQQAADSMSTVITSVFHDAEQFNRHLVQVKYKGDQTEDDGTVHYVETENVEERVYKKFDTKAIRDMTASIKDLALAVRNLYGLLTEPERSAMDIAAARLALDQRKEDGGEDDGESGVVEIAEALPEDDGGGDDG